MPGSLLRLHECRIQAVRQKDRVVDARSVRGRMFKNLSYLLPYINARGSGLDCTPEVGDTCLVLADESGLECIIGFRLTLAEGGDGLELGGRIDPLPDGSMAMRVVGEDGSEARLVCYRGGTVVLGSGALAVSVYTPMGGISHLFDNWEMTGPGGFVKWARDPQTSIVRYQAEYRVSTDPEADGFRVNVDIAPPAAGDSDPTPVRVTVTRKKDDDHPALDVSVGQDGRAHIKANILNIEALATITIDAPNVVVNGRRVRPIQEPM